MGTFGYALGPAVSSNITEYFGLEKLPFACFIGIITSFILLKNTPKLSYANIEKPQISIITAMKEIFSNKPVSILVMLSIVKSFVVSSFPIILPFYWKSIGFSVSKIGVILFMFMMAGALGVVSSPYIEKKLGMKTVFYISLIPVTILGLIFYLFKGQGITGLSAFILIGYVSLLASPINMALAQKLMPKFKSMISGFIGGFSWGIIGIILPAISLLGSKLGIINVLFSMTFVPLIFSYFIRYLPDGISKESV